MSGSYTTSRVNLFGKLDFSNKHHLVEQQSESMIAENGNKFIYMRNTHRPIKVDFYTYRIGAVWKINKQNTAEIVWNGYYDGWHLDGSRSIGKAYDPKTGKLKYSQETMAVAKEPYTYNAIHGNTHIIDTAGKQVSFDGDYISFDIHSNGRVSLSRSDESENTFETISDFRYDQPLAIKIGSLKGDVILPFTSFSLKTGVKYAGMRVHNPVSGWNKDTMGKWIPNPLAEDDYRYREAIMAGYVSFGKKWKKFELEAGGRVEYTSSSRTSKGAKENSKYIDVFPQFLLTFLPDKSHRMNLSLSRRISRPTYIDLGVARWYYDAAFESAGNPFLKPEYSLTTALTYSFKEKYIFGIDYTSIKDAILNSIRQDANGKSIWLSENFRHIDIVHAHVFVPFTIASKWKIQAYAEVFYTKQPIPSSSPTGETLQHRLHPSFSLNQQIDLPAGIRLDLSSRYIGRRLTGIRIVEPEFVFDAGLRYSFCNDKFSLSLTATDIFATVRDKYKSATDLTNYQHHSKSDTQRLSISLKYHIGGALKAINEHKTEEKKRL